MTYAAGGRSCNRNREGQDLSQMQNLSCPFSRNCHNRITQRYTLTLIEHIREAVRTCGVSQAEVARHTGIGPATLSRFVSGQGGLSPKSLDALATALQIVPVTVDVWERRERIWNLYVRGELRRVNPSPPQAGPNLA